MRESSKQEGIFLQVNNISKGYSVGESVLRDITLNLEKGESLALVGKSGAGKTTLAKIITRLIKPDTGFVYWEGKDVFRLTKEELTSFQRKVQYIPQDSSSALNPRFTAEEALLEPLEIHKVLDRTKRGGLIKTLATQVGLSSQHLTKRPHELSGGQRQRVVIARALALAPELLICDEPFSALDLNLQAQLVNLFQDLQRTNGITYLLISHDIALVRYLCSRVGVMHEGQIIEHTSVDEFILNPQKAYSKALMEASRQVAP